MNGHVNEWHGIKMKENPNLACDSKKAYEAKVQAHVNMWKGGFKEEIKNVKQTNQTNIRNLD